MVSRVKPAMNRNFRVPHKESVLAAIVVTISSALVAASESWLLRGETTSATTIGSQSSRCGRTFRVLTSSM